MDGTPKSTHSFNAITRYALALNLDCCEMGIRENGAGLAATASIISGKALRANSGFIFTHVWHCIEMPFI